MRLPSILVATLLAFAAVAMAHDFNHLDRHEACQIYGDPDLDRVGDGHAHKHDPLEAATLHNHDPCKQAGMLVPAFTDASPLEEITLAEAVLGDGDPMTTEVITDEDEAYRLPYPTADLKRGANLLVVGDASAGSLLPGAGTPTDPYIVEGYVLTGLLELRDTSKCYVVRNNVVEGGTIIGGLLDETSIVVLETLRATYESARDEALATLAALEAELAEWEAIAAVMEERDAEMEAAKAAVEAALATWEAAFDSFSAAYLGYMASFEALAADYEEYVRSYQPLSMPPPVPHGDRVDRPLPPFEGYMDQVRNIVLSTPPPPQPPEGWSGGSWDSYKARYQGFVTELGAAKSEYGDVRAQAPDLAAFAAFQEERRGTMDAYDAWGDEHATFLAAMAEFLAAYDSGSAAANAALAEVAAFMAKAAAFELEYEGPLAYLSNEVHLLAESHADLVAQALALVREVLPHVQSGRLVLDWNGQCVHAYNNIVEDLRVNQNNDRTGYATGGLLEDNRFHTIGQIRHYDGEFRQNEVGDRDHLRSLVDPAVAAPSHDRSVNNDGANQGWFHHNVIYGQVDLDFHGHHHAPGFFAPESHYHGSDAKAAYMLKPDGTFKLDANGQRIPHHDHAKRWTSVRFEDNTVIDPKGVGLRFEDQAHRGDDEKANSENMVELKRPHFHRSEVELRRNVVVGAIGIDTFNADGTWLWNDDWSPVKADLAGRILDAVQHLGADIVNSHPGRNAGWIDLEDNTQFLVGSGTAVRIVDAKQADEVELTGHRALLLGSGFSSSLDEDGMRAFLADAPSVDADTLWSTVSAWGGTRGTATAVELRNLRDVKVASCGNDARGFARGLVATDRVYTDASAADCGTSDWGGADPAFVVTTTPYPPPPPSCTAGLRDTTEPTQARYVLRPGYDVVDGVLGQVCTLLPGTVTETSVPVPAPIASATPTVKPGTVPRLL